ncbi:hypothetical protein GMD78_12095 [Ornithinibacillus sp. L9]|uniref:Cell surface protein n=1 Tax=Ornithinibacillus caprae TaxID=2678566 RepID=A0A6N8FI39_9BACI|nr:hypothetical protein [Ornithinibacillus caprae]MUK89115.1 hypothetical protein [Ornithinibacillus caprae]
MAEKVKKPFYKKWWVWLIAVIIFIAIITPGEDDSETASTDDNTEVESNESTNDSDEDEAGEPEETEEEETEEASSDVEESEPEDENKIESGTYKVGEDIPAGEYLVFAESMGYIESASDSTGDLDSIVFNDNLMNGAHSYVTLNEGEYFKLQGAVMYPVDSAPSVTPEDGVYTDGMYKVGQDIPAGEYKVLLNESSAAGMGYLEVSTDSRHQLESIVTNDNVQADTYITVSEGQYLKLQDLTIEN